MQGLQKTMVSLATESLVSQLGDSSSNESFLKHQSNFMKGFFSLVALDIEKAQAIYGSTDEKQQIELISGLSESNHICSKYFEDYCKLPANIKRGIVFSCIQAIKRCMSANLVEGI